MENIKDKKEFIKEHIALSINTKKEILGNSKLIQDIFHVSQSCLKAYQNGKKIILAGNGGSAADAQHIAAEFVSRFKFDRPGLSSIALTTDTSMLTAIGNDYGYEQVFARQLQANGNKGDILIAISTSGNSKNIIKLVEVAKSMKIHSVGFTNNDGGKLKGMCDICLSVPYNETAIVQESHIMFGHIICGYVEEMYFKEFK